VKKEIGNTTNYLWKKFECEVCENISREKRKSKGITLIRKNSLSKEAKEEEKETRLVF